MNPGDTPDAGTSEDKSWHGAQRRPGREPRRHSHRPSTSPGACGALNEGRGVNPGDTPVRSSRWTARGTLNEGRGVNPGDTARTAAAPGCDVQRAQRRPGREPRRHTRAPAGAFRRRRPLNEGRGVNPGDTLRFRLHFLAPVALNEGRGVNPGDTVSRWSPAGASPRAQRRPGREPRRHLPVGEKVCDSCERSTKAGA